MEIRDRIKEFRRIPAAELQANPKNWRKHPAAQRKAMSAVLQEIGYAGALLARESEDGSLVLIDGHLRAETTPGQIVPVLVLDVTEAESEKILATLDPIGAMAEIDKDGWARLIDGIQFSEADFGGLLQQIRPGQRNGNTDEDAIPEPPKDPVTRPGDLWLLGEHRLLCGDSTNPEDVRRLMAGERAVLFATDPPYLVDYTGMDHPSKIGQKAKASKNKDWTASYHEWDSSKGDGRQFYMDFCKVALDEAIDLRAAWYCWHASRRQAMLESVWEEHGAFVHQQIIWFKSRPVLTYSAYMWAHEPCFFGWMKGYKPRWNKQENYPTTVWSIPSSEVESSDHPTSKPVRVFSLPMELHTGISDVCYEPFAGSGSQIIAAEKLARRCYAMEKSAQYVDVCVKRWEEFTGKKATLETTRPTEKTDAVKSR